MCLNRNLLANRPGNLSVSLQLQRLPATSRASVDQSGPTNPPQHQPHPQEPPTGPSSNRHQPADGVLRGLDRSRAQEHSYPWCLEHRSVERPSVVISFLLQIEPNPQVSSGVDYVLVAVFLIPAAVGMRRIARIDDKRQRRDAMGAVIGILLVLAFFLAREGLFG